MNTIENVVSDVQPSEKSPNTWLVNDIYAKINNFKKSNHKISNELFIIPKYENRILIQEANLFKNNALNKIKL